MLEQHGSSRSTRSSRLARLARQSRTCRVESSRAKWNLGLYRTNKNVFKTPETSSETFGFRPGSGRLFHAVGSAMACRQERDEAKTHVGHRICPTIRPDRLCRRSARSDSVRWSRRADDRTWCSEVHACCWCTRHGSRTPATPSSLSRCWSHSSIRQRRSAGAVRHVARSAAAGCLHSHYIATNFRLSTDPERPCITIHWWDNAEKNDKVLRK